MDLGADILELQPLTGAEVVGGPGRAGQPAVVHSGADLPDRVAALPLLPLSLSHLPHQLHHERLQHHLFWAPGRWPGQGLVPPEPRDEGHGPPGPDETGQSTGVVLGPLCQSGWGEQGAGRAGTQVRRPAPSSQLGGLE